MQVKISHCLNFKISIRIIQHKILCLCLLNTSQLSILLADQKTKSTCYQVMTYMPIYGTTKNMKDPMLLQILWATQKSKTFNKISISAKCIQLVIVFSFLGQTKAILNFVTSESLLTLTQLLLILKTSIQGRKTF